MKPKQILDLCNCREDMKRKVHSIIDKYAERGLRSLAVARQVSWLVIFSCSCWTIFLFPNLILPQEVPEKSKDSPGGPWQFVGLLPLFDPPRHDSAETIRKALVLGVNVKMITGTNPVTTKWSWNLLGQYFHECLIWTSFVLQVTSLPLVRRLEGDLAWAPTCILPPLCSAKTRTLLLKHFLSMSSSKRLMVLPESSLVRQIPKYYLLVMQGIFCWWSFSYAEHKYEIVKRLQEKKHIVGMTGDGVNDAPALKKADIGIAVADATDAARSASDIVLTEPGLSVIISAVLTSRCIFQRMKNYTVSSFLGMFFSAFSL